ncbi:hypothetical protein [Endozoicomonas sp. SESOKO1]|uniref:hypothetical protein n=1 Tax=Endozoicomonas sp. SESOKO1 TaxID=2828742 RepID=UPI002148C6AB|nr:hypothetical protein [Endozoicomonas sp. SESOKO1]
MDLFSQLPLFDPDSADLYSSSADVAVQTFQFDASIPTSTYQGMSVKTLDASFPGYHNQSDASENDPVCFNLLNKHDIESLTISEIMSETAGIFGTDIPDIPESIPDEYIRGNSGYESVNDDPSLIPDIPLIQQICLSESEPGIREPTPQSHSNPDFSLTDLPDVLPDPQDLRPLTVVNPQNLNKAASDNQTTPAKDIVDGKRDLCKDPASELKRKRKRERIRELRKNPAYAERARKRSREYQRELCKDPAFLKRKRARQRECYHNSPDFAERKKKYSREHFRERYQNDPDFAERKKKHNRERYLNDPDFAERAKKRNIERKKNLRKDPAVDNGCAVHD